MFLAVLHSSHGSSAMDERDSRLYIYLHAGAYSHMDIVISVYRHDHSASITNRVRPCTLWTRALVTAAQRLSVNLDAFAAGASAIISLAG